MSTPAARLRQRLLHQDIERDVVDDVAVVVDHAILAVGGIRIERDVGHDAELGKALLQRARPRAAQAPSGCRPRGRPASSASGRSTGKSARAGMPSFMQCSATGSSLSTVMRCDARHGSHIFRAGFSVEHEHRDRSGRSWSGRSRASAAGRSRRAACAACAPQGSGRRSSFALILLGVRSSKFIGAGNFSTRAANLTFRRVDRLPLLLPERVALIQS